MEKFHFKQMRAPTDSFEVGSEGWLEGMSMRFQSAFEKTETYGIDRLIDVIRTVLPHKPWNHIPLGNPSKMADVYIEGITGYPYSVLISVISEFDKELAEGLESLIKIASKRDQIIERSETSKRLYSDGLTQQEIAERLGVSQDTISKDLKRKTVRNKKSLNPKRKLIRYEINSGTKPSTAATKILETFGVEFALSLADEILNTTVAKH